MKTKKSHSITITLLLIIFFFVVGLLLYAFEIPIFPTQKENTKQENDTTPPELKCSVRSLTLTKGESLSLDRLSLYVTDKSKLQEPFFSKVTSKHLNLSGIEENADKIATDFSKGIELYDTSYTFSYGGSYELIVSVKDEYENKSDYTLKITVEEPPQLSVPSKFYITPKTSVSFENYISYWDFLDTESTNEMIKINSDELDTNAIGTYPITFTAKDSYGLSSTITSSVSVCNAEDLQEMVYSHKINASDSVILGIKNVYDVGYYKENDTAFNKNLLLPTTVTFKRDNGTLEKGFIIEITDKYLKICTLAEAISDSLTRELAFFDGTVKKASVTNIYTTDNIAFLQIPTSEKETITSLTLEELKKLRAIHIDEAFWVEICPLLLSKEIPLSKILELHTMGNH